jgi:hypothetical protein
MFTSEKKNLVGRYGEDLHAHVVELKGIVSRDGLTTENIGV